MGNDVSLSVMKILMTGAHFTPAVAVIEQLKKFDNVQVVYVGRKTTLEGDKSKSVESSELPALGVKFISIVTGRLQRTLTLFTIPSLLKIPVGFFQALLIILSEKPGVILSFGGYVAVPLVIVGWFCSIPIIIHEQGLVPGLANRICAIFADKIATSFKNKGFTGNKVILTGNPIRKEILQLSESANTTRLKGSRGTLPFVLITGGNQGSHVINLAVEKCLNKLTKKASLIHVVGENNFGDFPRLKALESDHYIVEKWVGEDWADVLSRVDIVISRAGINTLSELAFLAKPTLLIPIPNKEQQTNAKYFEDLQIAKVLPQSMLSPENLLHEISYMLKNLDNLKYKAQEAKKIVIADAAKRLAQETMLLGKSKNN